MRMFFAMLITYLVGSVPTGYLFTKFLKNTDLRNVGSGNVGATNVFRAAGKAAAFLTLVIDMLKGFIAVTFLADMLYSFRMNMVYPQFQAILAVCVVAGHNWPLFLDFRGGKGVATSAGVLLALCPLLLLIGCCVWLIVYIFSRIVSLSSIIAAVSISLASYFYSYGRALRLLTITLAVLAIIRHKANIKRLVRNEERKP